MHLSSFTPFASRSNHPAGGAEQRRQEAAGTALSPDFTSRVPRKADTSGVRGVWPCPAPCLGLLPCPTACQGAGDPTWGCVGLQQGWWWQGVRLFLGRSQRSLLAPRMRRFGARSHPVAVPTASLWGLWGLGGFVASSALLGGCLPLSRDMGTAGCWGPWGGSQCWCTHLPPPSPKILSPHGFRAPSTPTPQG